MPGTKPGLIRHWHGVSRSRYAFSCSYVRTGSGAASPKKDIEEGRGVWLHSELRYDRETEGRGKKSREFLRGTTPGTRVDS
eukprot:3032726-Prymnesium_polylepis.2